MKKPELLSPVGNPKCVEAAIQGGCDAIYLGGYAFGARSYAGNFSDEELIKTIAYAHEYGVKVYVTMNTLIYDDETEMFLNYVNFLYQNHVDAIIIQDLGMLHAVRKIYPNLEVHASTQMHIHNEEGVQFLEKMGVKRAVIARETSYQVISEIKKRTQIELEVFVHGALCVSYSGQCLMSSMIGGRSGNRGTCTQCCRMPYTLLSNQKKRNQEDYILSPKDLNSLENIGKLIDIGVDSFKIEGRMKRPEYVYFVTHLYRKAIDEYFEKKTITISEEELICLKKLFHREFTKGFLFHEEIDQFFHPERPNHIGIEIGHVEKWEKGMVTCLLTSTVTKGDGIRILDKKVDVGCTLNQIYQHKKLVTEARAGEMITFPIKNYVQKGDRLVKTSDLKDLQKINQMISAHKRKVKIKGHLAGKIGEPLILSVTDGCNEVTIKGKKPLEKASNAPITQDRIYFQLKKLGNTIYELESLTFALPDFIFIPIQELNQMKREGIDQLKHMRCYQFSYYKESYELEVPFVEENDGFTACIDTIDAYLKIKNKEWKQIYAPESIYVKIAQDHRVTLQLSNVMLEHKEKQNPLLVGELGSLKYHPYYTDVTLNVTNSYTVAFLHYLGIKRVTVSYELTDFQLENMIISYQQRYHKKPNIEWIVSAYPEVMTSACNLYHLYPDKKLELKNENGDTFFIKDRGKIMRIYDKKRVEHKNIEAYFKKGIHTLRISFIKPE